MLTLKSKEMKDLLVEISKAEDQNVGKDQKITFIDTEIEDLVARVAKLKADKQHITKEKDMAQVTVPKLNSKKTKLENYIETEMERTASKEKEIKRKN